MNKTIGIDAIAFAVPEGYLDLRDLAEARGVPAGKYIDGLGVEQMAVARSEEDPVALAANAGPQARLRRWRWILAPGPPLVRPSGRGQAPPYTGVLELGPPTTSSFPLIDGAPRSKWCGEGAPPRSGTTTQRRGAVRARSVRDGSAAPRHAAASHRARGEAASSRARWSNCWLVEIWTRR